MGARRRRRWRPAVGARSWLAAVLAARPRLGGARRGRLQLPHGDHDRSHAHRQLDRRDDAVELSAAARHHEHEPEDRPRNGGHVQNANGYDISFQGADTTTCGGPSTCIFNYEIESYTRQPDRPRDRLGQDPGAQDDGEHGEHGHLRDVRRRHRSRRRPRTMNGTWNTNFKGVWHLNQAQPGRRLDLDAAPNASHNGAPTPATAAGLIGSGVGTSGTTGHRIPRLPLGEVQLDFVRHVHVRGLVQDDRLARPALLPARQRRRQPGHRHQLGYDGIDHQREQDGRARPRRHGRHLRRGQRLDGPQRRHLAPLRCHAHRRHRSRSTSTAPRSAPATNAGASGSITTGAAGNYQNIGREGNWVAIRLRHADEQYLAATFDEFRISNTLRSADWIIDRLQHA